MTELLRLFKALSDKTRLRIVKLLEAGELCASDITASLDLDQPRVSFHPATLRKAGLVKNKKEGKWMKYDIDSSDMFKRMLLFSVIERFSERVTAEDRRRLEAFLKSKEGDLKLHPQLNRKS